MDRQVPVLVKKDLACFSDSGNRLPHFNPFATAFASLGPAERYEAEFMGASEFLNRRLNEEFSVAFWLKCIDGQLGPLTLLADSWFCPVRTW